MQSVHDTVRCSASIITTNSSRRLGDRPHQANHAPREIGAYHLSLNSAQYGRGVEAHADGASPRARASMGCAMHRMT
ncbi:hypothetical protein OBBRIDRAFT_266924 [Obba rivulosa]|uniref:Uncharacterized protein n=1 Tax=Obba rivulosa TaxID=1052685 RepID=A0A8E2J351_9APHY|nr:hypothetical protein OBBRIDRAFT_266924 [Obba rivulosa]